jgi:hypothetical protein
MAYRQNRVGAVLETPYTVYLKHYQNQAGGALLGKYGDMHVYRPANLRGNGLGSIFRSVWKFISPIFGSETVKDLGRRTGERIIDAGADTARQLLQNGDINVADALKMAGKRTLQDIGADALSTAQTAFDPRPQAGSGIKRRRRQVEILLKNAGKFCGTKRKRRRRKRKRVGGKRKRKVGRKRKSVGKRRRKVGKKRRKVTRRKKPGKKRRKSRKKAQVGGRRKSKYPIFL